VVDDDFSDHADLPVRHVAVHVAAHVAAPQVAQASMRRGGLLRQLQVRGMGGVCVWEREHE